jgi:hypothetical protein
MAVIATILAVVVAAVGIKSASVRVGGHRRESECNNCKTSDHVFLQPGGSVLAIGLFNNNLSRPISIKSGLSADLDRSDLSVATAYSRRSGSPERAA